MHAWHDQPFADHGNGFDGLATRLQINGAFGVKMMELLARGAKEGWFTYNGPLNKAEGNMGDGESGVFTPSSALNQINPGKTTTNSQGIRLGNYPAIRDAIEEQLENIFAGKKTPQQGMDDAVAKSNEILKEFAPLYK